MILELLFNFLKYKKNFMIFMSLPKGRNFFSSLKILKSLNIFLIKNIYRKIILLSNRKNFFFIVLKNKDLQKIIKYGFLNFSIIGTDLISNKKKKIKIKKLNSYLYLNNNFIIITKFFNICNYYKINFFNFKINGVLEFFLNFKKIGIIDISETSVTLYKNNFFPNKFLMKINLFLIYNNLKKNIINSLINNVKNI